MCKWWYVLFFFNFLFEIWTAQVSTMGSSRGPGTGWTVIERLSFRQDLCWNAQWTVRSTVLTFVGTVTLFFETLSFNCASDSGTILASVKQTYYITSSICNLDRNSNDVENKFKTFNGTINPENDYFTLFLFYSCTVKGCLKECLKK